MDEYRVKNIFGKTLKKNVSVSVPGSKSITNRALLLAALSDGECRLNGALFSDDSRHFLSCVQALGIRADADEEKKSVVVGGLGGDIPNREASIYVGSAGTAARFITAFLGVSKGNFYLDSSEQMKKRPMAPLLKALRELGCQVICAEEEGHFPFRLISDGVKTNEISVDIGDSSQFLSALLISAACIEDGLKIKVLGTHGMSYINITTEMMKKFGVGVERSAEDIFYVPGGQNYSLSEYDIEPDMSAAAYFYAAAAILGCSVTVNGVHRGMLQGDEKFLDVLEQMGCKVKETSKGVCVTGPEGGKIHGVDVDMSAFSDQALTLAAIAPFADSPVCIRGIGHIRHQECDRINAIVDSCARMGIKTEEFDGGIRIFPGEPKTANIQTFEDHRVAMSFAVTGLRASGITIENPMCCRKTFENFFEVLEEMAGKLTS